MAPMNFNENGTISVDIDGQTYTLKRPTLGQLWSFFDLIAELTEAAQQLIKDKAEELAQVEEDSEEARQLAADMGGRRFAFRYLSEPWLRRAFEELGSKPLPENLDNAPSEFADPGLPNEILLFWRDVPLAHSRRRT